VYWARSVPLQDGRVLIAGGGNSNGKLFNTAELWYPPEDWVTNALEAAEEWFRCSLLKGSHAGANGK
jgi:hypothetical protein